MTVIIPRVCEGCGKEFVRRGRAKKCEDCSPPGTKTASKKTPADYSKRTDIEYATQFMAGGLATIGVGLMPVSKHDAAVIFRSAGILPVQMAKVMEQDAHAAEVLTNIARKGSLYMLCGTLLLTVVMPIMANHGIFVPKSMAMDEKSVDETLSNALKAFAESAANAQTVPESDAYSDLDLSFLKSESDAA